MKRIKGGDEPQSVSTLVDPDPAVVAGLAFAGLAALGSLTTALVHLRNRIDATRARRKATRAKLAKWGQAATTLAIELESFRDFLQRVHPQPENVPIVGTRLLLSASDALVYRDFVAKLALLTKAAAALSLDLTELLAGEAERRAWFGLRKLELLLQELPQLGDEQHHALEELWGTKTIDGFLPRAERLARTLAKFEADMQRCLTEE